MLNIPKSALTVIGIAIAVFILAMGYVLVREGEGVLEFGELKLTVGQAGTSLPGQEIQPASTEVSTRKAGGAIVIDPPSNVRLTPNGTILCAVTSKGAIPIYEKQGDWYQTDVCGEMGLIHISQLSFKADALKTTR